MSAGIFLKYLSLHAWRSKAAEEAKEQHMADKAMPAVMFLKYCTYPCLALKAG
jgi:hypothetical protein